MPPKRLVEQAMQLPLEEKLRLREALLEIRPLDYTSHAIRLHCDSLLEAQVRTLSCVKEPGTVAWIEKHLRAGDVFYDVGANVGAYSLVAAKCTANQATVVAFEPSHLNFHQLCRNIALNECTASVTPLHLALCRQSAWSRFHCHKHESGSSFHSFGRNLDKKGRKYPPSASLGAIGFSLDDLVAVTRLPAPNLIKLDVDGLERDILEGAAGVLRSSGLRSLLLEMNEAQADDCAAMLALLHDAGLCPTEKHLLNQRVHNYLFFRAEQPPARPLQPAQVPVTYRRAEGFAPWKAAG